MSSASTYLISRVGDPLFALFIGFGAAATRINREEKEQGRTTQQTIDAGLRYVTAFPVDPWRKLEDWLEEANNGGGGGETGMNGNAGEG